MPTQKTQARERLGALVKRARRQAGMPRQDHLAAATGLSISVISLVERGAKVEDKTLRIIEETLRFAPGSFIDFIEGRIDELPSPGEPPTSAAPTRRKSVIDMNRAELFEMAEYVAQVKGEDAAADWLRGALQMQADHRQKARDQAAQTFDNTQSLSE